MLKLTVLLFFLLLLGIIVSAFLNPFPKTNPAADFKLKYGVSYSFEQATWYGLDARSAYVDLLENVRFDWVRIPFFWDQMTGANGELKIDDLKFGIEEAKKRNVKVVVALGMKTPYYPEFHLPEKERSELKFGQTIDLQDKVGQEVVEVDKKLVSQLSSFDNIVAWQVENEPFLPNVNGWRIGASLLQAEVDAVRGSDPKGRAVILNHVGPSVFDRSYKPLLSILEPGDVFGVNAYFKTQGTYLFTYEIFGKVFHINWPKWLIWPVQSWMGFSPDFASLKKEAGKRGVGLWVLEMQAEPYIRTLEDAKSQKFFYKASDILKADIYLRGSQIESIGLWGAPFWLYRQKNGDDSWIEAVKSLGI